MNDSIIACLVDSLTQEVVSQSLQLQTQAQTPVSSVDWTAVTIIFMVILLPVLIVFCYLGYKKYLQFRRRKLNDDLIVRLAQQGQNLTPELIDTIRRDEKSGLSTASSNPSEDAYQKLCIGGALCIGGIIVCLRNRAIGLIMLIVGLFTLAQGLALWLISRDSK